MKYILSYRSTSKTKPLVFLAKDTEYTKYCKLVSPIHTWSTDVNFVTNAEHLGTTRLTSGNLPHIQQCISNQKKKLGMVLSSWMARRHKSWADLWLSCPLYRGCYSFVFSDIVQLGPRSKQSLSLKVWTKRWTLKLLSTTHHPPHFTFWPVPDIVEGRNLVYK